MIVNRGMGLDPVTAGLIAQVAAPALKNLLGGGGPDPALIAAAQAQAQAQAAQQRVLMYAGLAAVGAVVLVVALRR